MNFEEFASLQFNREEMKKRLPRPIYEKWKQAYYRQDSLDPTTADAIAEAMKEWALERGATHYSHWFTPLTGQTAEKHHSFAKKVDGDLLLSFSGSALIKGETDGSSFPSAGLRTTFEARGYTYWDLGSFAFVKGSVLYIPSIFVSYLGEQLDLKSPLLKAVDVFSRGATKLCHHLGKEDVKAVIPMVGLEQEYYLIDEKDYEKRPDLVYTGRTLMGSPPPKGIEFDDHYLGSIPPRVKLFMKDVNEALWKLGIFSTCEHNETASGQFEIVSLYDVAGLTIDQNMILMDVLKEKAREHGFVCLLHEKPFAYSSGSGKHNNLSLSTSEGENLLDPGSSAMENVSFLFFLTAFIAAVDRHPVLLRLAASDAGNDERLGGGEAPPAIVSIYLGDELTSYVESLLRGEGSDVEKKHIQPTPYLPELPAEIADRNRTSTIAFTGDKFEMRMLGSSRSAAMLNLSALAAMSEVIEEMNQELEEKRLNQREEFLTYLSGYLAKHKRVLFEGDGYSKAWREEAKRRGLPMPSSYAHCIEILREEKTMEMFSSQGVLTPRELHSRADILYEQYANTLLTEARTLNTMLIKDVKPALMKEIERLYSLPKVEIFEKELEEKITLYASLQDIQARLEASISTAQRQQDLQRKSLYLANNVRKRMTEARGVADHIESVIAREFFPYPTYGRMLHGL